MADLVPRPSTDRQAVLPPIDDSTIRRYAQLQQIELLAAEIQNRLASQAVAGHMQAVTAVEMMAKSEKLADDLSPAVLEALEQRMRDYLKQAEQTSRLTAAGLMAPLRELVAEPVSREWPGPDRAQRRSSLAGLKRWQGRPKQDSARRSLGSNGVVPRRVIG
jgi:hypothetical protein